MTRAGRLLALLQALRGRRRAVTASELAAEFAVSERTVYRDLKTLAAQGAPIEGAAGLGFVLRPGFFLPPLTLEPDEADAVALGLRFVMRRGDARLKAAARSAAAKVGSVLPASTGAAAAGNGLVVAPSGSGASERLGEAREALAAERKLRLRYRDGRGASSERVVWPVALGFFDAAEILVAWCETRRAFRHFRLDRVEALERLDEPLPSARRTLFARWRAIETGVET